MTTTPPATADTAPAQPRKLTKAEQRASEAKTKLSSPWATGIAIVMAVDRGGERARGT